MPESTGSKNNSNVLLGVIIIVCSALVVIAIITSPSWLPLVPQWARVIIGFVAAGTAIKFVIGFERSNRR